MDKIEKALKKLTEKERQIVKEILTRLIDNNIIGINLEKMKGEKDIFRIRKSRIRIIYRVDINNQIFILKIDRRNEKTYKKF